MQNYGDAGQSTAALARAFGARTVPARAAMPPVLLADDSPPDGTSDGASLDDRVSKLESLHAPGHPHAFGHAPIPASPDDTSDDSDGS